MRANQTVPSTMLIGGRVGISWGRRQRGRSFDDCDESGADREEDVIDLRASASPPVPIDESAIAARMEALRRRREKCEAEQELHRLRARHWAGERLIEEGCRELEWWEHPEADPYAVLGLLPGAALDEASAARRAIAQRCHPDRFTGPDEERDHALRRLIAANSAYERLRRALRPI